MTKIAKTSLVLVGIALGCAASSVAPTTGSWAQEPGGAGWSCYVADRLPDVDAAAEWDGAASIAAGMNRVAMHVPSGAVFAVTPKSSRDHTYAGVICVKH